jgi:hypothetical protein
MGPTELQTPSEGPLSERVCPIRSKLLGTSAPEHIGSGPSGGAESSNGESNNYVPTFAL